MHDLPPSLLPEIADARDMCDRWAAAAAGTTAIGLAPADAPRMTAVAGLLNRIAHHLDPAAPPPVQLTPTLTPTF